MFWKLLIQIKKPRLCGSESCAAICRSCDLHHAQQELRATIKKIPALA
jgi:hypothetical protein